MIKLLDSKWLFLISIPLIICSCSKGDDNTLIGEWDLKSIESMCLEENTQEEIEILESNGLCCLSITTTKVDSGVKSSITTLNCQKMWFKSEGELDIIRMSNTSRDTASFTYQVLNNTIEVCPIIDKCVNYTLMNDEIELTIESMNIAGSICERKFIYRK